jgi:hypothetical protein
MLPALALDRILNRPRAAFQGRRANRPPTGTPALLLDFVTAPATALDLWFSGAGVIGDPVPGAYTAAVTDASTGTTRGQYEVWK